MAGITDTLARIVGPSGMLTGDDVRARKAGWLRPTPSRARAIVRPANTDEVSAVLKACFEAGQAVVPVGGNTGLVDGTQARDDEIQLSLERMAAIESIDRQAGTMTVQAGVALQAAQDAAAAEDLMFALDLGARGSATIGGTISTNAGGNAVIRYGMMREQVLGLEAVLADGTVLTSMNRMLKNNAGYDLKQLFIGSEGTLGIVTRAVLRLFPLPSSCNTALVALPDFEAVSTLLGTAQRQLAGTLSAYEVMWGDYYRAVTEPGTNRAPLTRDYPFYAVLEAEGADQTGDSARFEKVLEEAFEKGLIVDAVIAKSEAERREVWDVRENFESVLPGFLYDVSLPISAMGDYSHQVIAAAKARWPGGECLMLGHIADGNLHLFVKPNETGDWHEESDSIVYEPLQGLGGSVSAEHGIGTEKLDWLGSSRSETEIATMRLLKRSLDPHNLLNPNRVLQQA